MLSASIERVAKAFHFVALQLRSGPLKMGDWNIRETGVCVGILCPILVLYLSHNYE